MDSLMSLNYKKCFTTFSRGENVANHFLDQFQIELDIFRSKFVDPYIMIISEKEQEAFNNATLCVSM